MVSGKTTAIGEAPPSQQDDKDKEGELTPKSSPE